jgi:hypothetical protein
MKYKENSRGFIQIIVIILAVLVLVAGAYYFGTKNKTVPTPVASAQPSSSLIASPRPTATTDPTANWKTYSFNTFSFKYPESYFVNKTTLEDNTSIIFIDSKKVVIPETWDYNLAPIEIRYNPNITSATDIVDLAKAQATPETLINKQSLVSGVRLYTITGKLVEGYMGGQDYYEAVFDAPKGIVKLNYWDYFKDGVVLNTVENIISSFKFTE